MPDDRIKKVTVFLERDEAFFREIDKLSTAVILNETKAGPLLDVHRVEQMAVDTGLVREEEIRVAQLPNERFLIQLPRGLAVDTFVKATPGYLWDEGFIFQHWSQMEGAQVLMPRFKVLIDLIGVPPHLWREDYIVSATAKLGLFLGTVAPEHASDYTAWRLAIATDDLRRIPPTMGMVVGGVEHPIEVKTIAWSRGPIYQASDFPVTPPVLPRPPIPPLAPNQILNGTPWVAAKELTNRYTALEECFLSYVKV